MTTAPPGAPTRFGSFDERFGYLAGTLASVSRDVVEIKADVRTLLAAQWRRDGRAGAVAAVVSVGVTLGAWLLR